MHQSAWTFSIFHPLFTLVLTQTNGLPFLTSVLLSYVCNFTSLQAQQDQNNIWSPDLPPSRFSHPSLSNPWLANVRAPPWLSCPRLNTTEKKSNQGMVEKLERRRLLNRQVVAHGKGYPFTGQCFKAGKICYVIKSHLATDTTIRKHLIVIKKQWKKAERVWDWDNKNILCFMKGKLTRSVQKKYSNQRL